MNTVLPISLPCLRVAALMAITGLLASCDGAVQLCGQYACVYYANECETGSRCERKRECESAGSIRDRAPRILNELRTTQRQCPNAGSGILSDVDPNNVLAWDSGLAAVSQSHARDMSDNGFESFTGSNGLTSLERVAAAGIESSYVVENIGSGPQTAAEIINQWLDVETDCKNMLSLQASRIGMACSIDDNNSDGPYWSIILAGPEQ